MNLYARLADVKDDVNISGTARDAEIVRLIERVSRAVDDYTNREFYSQVATRYYNVPALAVSELWLWDDLLSVTTLKVDQDGDGVYETTLTTDDYWLWPDNETPKVRIDLRPDGALGSWPTGRRRVEVAGMFGYSNETELTTTTLAEELDASETGVDVADGTAVSAGETIVVDSEQMKITAIATNTLTVVRGINGTTAATHSNGVAVYRRRYARPVEEAVTLQVVRFAREHQTGASGQQGGNDIGGYVFGSLYPAIRDLLTPYKRLVAV